MKRKIFSKLLMVALVIAAVGSFVSCKDYDDDINNLQKQIDAKAALSELTALQSTLDSKIAAAQSAATAAQAKADAAATKTSVDELKKALETAIADAKKAGTDAGTKAGDAITAANKAQETAEAAAQAAKDADKAAKDALADALKTIGETYQTKAEAAEAATKAAEALADVKTIAEAAYTKAEAEKLQEQVNNLKSDLESSIEEKVKEAIKNVENAKASVDAIWSAVTSIEFLVSDMGDIDNNTVLNFQFGKQVDNVFGDGKELHAYESTDKPATYKAGDDIKAENIFYVRVSPVTADLTASTLKMVNSLGEDLSDYVDIKAEAYNELITRAGATGIWKLTATLKEGIDRANLEKAAHAVFSLNKKVQKSVAVYAIAACNTEDEADRFAVTSYDLFPKLNEYTPAYELNFYVNKNEVADIRNRWYEDGDDYYILSESNDEERDTTNWELAWNAAQAKAGEFDVPAVKAQKNVGKSNKYNNYVKDENDARRDAALKFLQVQVDEPIKVTFDSDDYPYVDKYYVLLEKDNAIESKPSEYESWLSYNIEGLGQMKKASETLTLTIPAAAAEGDIVGFRLYAVNFDGTLVDPDGKAFYVQVGNINSKAEPQVITGTFNPKKVGVAAANATEAVKDTINAVVIPFDAASMFKIANKTKAADFANFGLKANVTIKRGTEDNTMTLAENTTAKIFYLKSNELITKDGKQVAQTATTFDEIKYIAISVTNPESIIDGEAVQTEPLTIIDYDKQAKPVLGNIAFLLTKGEVKGVISEPTEASKFSWKSGQNGTFYLASNGTPGVTAGTFQWGVADKYFSEEAGAFQEFNLYDYSNGLDNYTDAAYTWTVKHGDVETVIADHTAAIVTAQYSWLVDEDETNTATFTITKGAATGVKTISRVLDVVGEWDDADEDSYLVELDNSAIVNQTLTFADPMLSQTWTMELPKYKVATAEADETKDATLASTGTQELGLSYSKVVAGTNKVLFGLWKDATLKTVGGLKRIDTEAVKFTAANIAGATEFKTLESIFPKASNSVLKTANWAWDFTTLSATDNYNARLKGLLPISAADAAKGVKNVYVEKLGGGGTKDEYVKATVTFDKTTPANGVNIEFDKSTTTAVTYNTELQLQLVIKVEDRFAQTKTFTIPFTLIP